MEREILLGITGTQWEMLDDMRRRTDNFILECGRRELIWM